MPGWKYHVGKISVRLEVFGEEWDPNRVLPSSGLEPSESLRPHQSPRLLPFSKREAHPDSVGVWALDTAAHVKSRDVKEHFQYLLNTVLPRLEQFDAATHGAARHLTLHWESTQAGTTGPELSLEILSGLAQLKAPLQILVHRIDEVDITADP
jgi:hypothetical protein